MRRSIVRVIVVAFLGLALWLSGPQGSASAASRWPAPPTGIRVSEIGPNHFRVVTDRKADATAYRLYFSRSKADLWIANLSRARVVSSARPSLTAAGLSNVATPYYWRVATKKGSRLRYSAIRETYVRPPVPKDVAVGSGPGLWLTWRAESASRYEVLQSTDPTMTVDRRILTVRGPGNQITPPDLTPGSRYFFKVRAVNGTTPSAWSAQVSGGAVERTIPVRVMTYNLLVRTADGSSPRGVVVPPWTPIRRDAAADLVRGQDLDFIAVQEGSQYTGSTWHSPRQVDSFATALGPDWTVAHTQGLWFESDYRLTGSHILYRNTAWRAVGQGGNWALGHGRYAAYQVLEHRESLARVLAISVHLSSQQGADHDLLRREETQRLVERTRAYLTGIGSIPVVYAGDMGSVATRWSPNDEPGRILRSTHVADAIDVAPTLVNPQYSSVNQYRSTPVMNAGSVDRILTSPGIAVSAWTQLLNVSDGRFAGVLPSDHNPVLAALQVPVPSP